MNAVSPFRKNTLTKKAIHFVIAFLELEHELYQEEHYFFAVKIVLTPEEADFASKQVEMLLNQCSCLAVVEYDEKTGCLKICTEASVLPEVS